MVPSNKASHPSAPLHPGPTHHHPSCTPRRSPRRQCSSSLSQQSLVFGHLETQLEGVVSPQGHPGGHACEQQAAAQCTDPQHGRVLSPSPRSQASEAPSAKPLGSLFFRWPIWGPSPSLLICQHPGLLEGSSHAHDDSSPVFLIRYPRAGGLGPCSELATPSQACPPCWWEGTHQPKGLVPNEEPEGGGGSPGLPLKAGTQGSCQLCPSCRLVPGAVRAPPVRSVLSAQTLGPALRSPTKSFL